MFGRRGDTEDFMAVMMFRVHRVSNQTRRTAGGGGVMLYQVTKANNLFNVGDTVEVVKKIGKRIWTVKRLRGDGATGNVLGDNLTLLRPPVKTTGCIQSVGPAGDAEYR